MRSERIYDPKRTPRHWAETLGPGQFALIVRDAQTTQIVDQNGEPFPSHDVESCFIFDSMTQARSYASNLVKRVDHVQCEIYDKRGMSAEPIFTIVNERKQRSTGTRKGAKRLIVFGLISMLPLPVLVWYDWLSSGARIWPTVVGLNLFFLGVRLLMWGYNDLERIRALEKEQARFADEGDSSQVSH